MEQFFENYRSRLKIWATFWRYKSSTYVLILTKTEWATIGAIFSQTHLVTLVGSSDVAEKNSVTLLSNYIELVF
jgi:hypothetical protein